VSEEQFRQAFEAVLDLRVRIFGEHFLDSIGIKKIVIFLVILETAREGSR